MELPLTSRRHTHAGGALFMLFTTECLRKTVGSHLRRWNVLDPDNLVIDGFAHEMVTDIDVFGTSVGHWILGQGDSALTV